MENLIDLGVKEEDISCVFQSKYTPKTFIFEKSREGGKGGRNMGLFDKVLGKETGTVSLTKSEAFAAVGFAAMAVDGDVSQDEIRHIVANLTTLGAFRGYDDDDLTDTLDKVGGLIVRRGFGGIFSAVKAALTEEELKAAFFLAADLVLADGVVEEEEKKLLEDLKNTLQIDDDTALKILEVAVIKNSG